ncbi:hypothetical protein [Nostoc sp. 'Lobaria pulmonaria (5183) cyanobiont']|uniref:hypothetical protein n=1 Tax=Nostoc sp. 'Lobaria pulmonaria (5183) cyanobiont' TaxID=1618022 RepID=UPI000CF318BA|nr:hypothetical protein [Nostoc sp. 'Lobaria pulmonaria (5183) cyanobiont']
MHFGVITAAPLFHNKRCLWRAALTLSLPQQAMSNDKPKKRLSLVFEVFCKAIALTLLQQAMSNDKPLRVYALFLRFSAKRAIALLSSKTYTAFNWMDKILSAIFKVY